MAHTKLAGVTWGIKESAKMTFGPKENMRVVPTKRTHTATAPARSPVNIRVPPGFDIHTKAPTPNIPLVSPSSSASSFPASVSSILSKLRSAGGKAGKAIWSAATPHNLGALATGAGTLGLAHLIGLPLGAAALGGALTGGVTRGALWGLSGNEAPTSETTPGTTPTPSTTPAASWKDNVKEHLAKTLVTPNNLRGLGGALAGGALGSFVGLGLGPLGALAGGVLGAKKMYDLTRAPTLGEQVGKAIKTISPQLESAGNMYLNYLRNKRQITEGEPRSPGFF